MVEQIYNPDVVVVGGGVAGLTVAINLAPRKVCVITKDSLGINTSSTWSQAGIAASVDKNDSNEMHISDTLKTAKGLGNETVARKIISESKATIKDLEDIVKTALKSNEKTILIVIYNNLNQKRYIGVKLD